MASERDRIEHALLDWRNEKEYRLKVMNDPNAPEKEKEFSKRRVGEAEYWINKILTEHPEVGP